MESVIYLRHGKALYLEAVQQLLTSSSILIP